MTKEKQALEQIAKIRALHKEQAELLVAIEYQLLRKLYPKLNWDNNPLDRIAGKLAPVQERSAFRTAKRLLAGSG